MGKNRITRGRLWRRESRELYIEKREEIIKNSGFKQGTIYKKHRDKIRNSGAGYMAKHGVLLHYANGYSRASQKVRDRKSYNGTNNWSRHDIKQMDSMDEQVDSYKIT